jgi:hypothetical protein
MCIYTHTHTYSIHVHYIYISISTEIHNDINPYLSIYLYVDVYLIIYDLYLYIYDISHHLCIHGRIPASKNQFREPQ